MTQKIDLGQTLETLKKNKVKYKLKRKNHSFELESDAINFKEASGKSKLSYKELGFIKRVRNHAKKSDLYGTLDYITTMDINYVGYNLNILKNGLQLNKVLEIDINQAYWEIAKRMGVISEELYNEGSKNSNIISKSCRLVALGSLARREFIYIFDPDVSLLPQCIEKEDTDLRMMFLHICKVLGEILTEIRRNLYNQYLFHWVDAVFIEDTEINRKIVINILKKYQLQYKVIPLSLIVEDNKIITTRLESKNGVFGEKRYNLPMKNYKKIAYAE